MAAGSEAVAADDGRIAIRKATAADADALALLSQELLAFYGLPVRYQRSYMAHTIAEKAFGDPPTIEILLAVDRSQPVGFIAFAKMFALANGQLSVFIQDLFVTRKARSLGVGRLLMRHLAQWCIDNGVTQLDWTADPWNDKARRFYEGMGPLLRSDKTFYRLLGPRLTELARGDE